MATAPAPAAWLPPGDERAKKASSERLMTGAGGRAEIRRRAPRSCNSGEPGAGGRLLAMPTWTVGQPAIAITLLDGRDHRY